MSESFVERLRRGTLLMDGGMGSALIDRGLEGGASGEVWNLERPDIVRRVHAAYFAAGSDMVHSNTFGANEFVLARHDLSDEMGAINRAGARLARDAAEAQSHPVFVAGDMGPTGRFLPPVGDTTESEMEAAFAAQAAELDGAGVDALSIETMPDLREALCALRGALGSTPLPVMVSLTYDKKKRGFFTIMGDRPDEACRVLADAGATAVGGNCSISSGAMLELAAIFLEASPVPVTTQPNAGLPELVGTRTVYGQEPRAFAHDMAAAAAAGVSAIGGCCGTDVRFIAALRAHLGGDVDAANGESVE